MTQLRQTPRPSGESLICRLAAVQFPRQNQFQWWRKCPWVQHCGTHCDGWAQWISLAFSRRAVVMRSPPRFLCGGKRAAMRLALPEMLNGADREDDIAQCRGWKLFLLLPRLLLFRPPRGGLIPKQQLQNRLSLFSRRVGTIVVTVRRMWQLFPKHFNGSG